MSESMDGVSGICHRCGQFRQVVFREGAGYCHEHVPLQLTNEDFDMIFDKADVAGPTRHKEKSMRGAFTKVRRMN